VFVNACLKTDMKRAQQAVPRMNGINPDQVAHDRN
jgi:hypothetical protein